MKQPILFILLILFLISCKQQVATIEIDAGDHDRFQVPIVIELPGKIDRNQKYSLVNIQNGQAYGVHLVTEQTLVTLIDHLPSRSKTIFHLVEGENTKTSLLNVSLEESPEGIQINAGGKPILFYQSSTTLPAQGDPDYYKRSGFIHPLHSPGGAILTDDFPVGHVHQHAIFNAWTNTTFRGQKVDFWNQQHQLGTVAHTQVLSMNDGYIGHLKTELSHISLADGEVLRETWDIVIYPLSDYFLFDIYSEQTNTTSDTLFLNEYIYGGMAFRGSKEWNMDDTVHFSNIWKILSNEGLTLENVNHTKAKWIDATGEVDGKVAGVTIFGFPDNFRYPQMVRVHPEMPYWVFSPVVEGPAFIAPGEKFTSRYRYYVHDGVADTNLLQNIQRDLENPVTVSVY
jgi:hypothetical protein